MSGRGSAVVAAMEAGSLVLVSAERSAEKRDLGLNGRRLPSFQSHPFTLPETHGGEGRPVQVSGTPPEDHCPELPAPGNPVSVGKSDAVTRQADRALGAYIHIFMISNFIIK